MKVHSVIVYDDNTQNSKGKTLSIAFNKIETNF